MSTSIPNPPPNAWTWTSDGWTRLSPDGTRLEHGGTGLSPVEPVRVFMVGGSTSTDRLDHYVGFYANAYGGSGSSPKPTDRAPVARWRLWLRRLLRRRIA